MALGEHQPSINTHVTDVRRREGTGIDSTGSYRFKVFSLRSETLDLGIFLRPLPRSETLVAKNLRSPLRSPRVSLPTAHRPASTCTRDLETLRSKVRRDSPRAKTLGYKVHFWDLGSAFRKDLLTAALRFY